jgi:hypothetical protein
MLKPSKAVDGGERWSIRVPQGRTLNAVSNFDCKVLGTQWLTTMVREIPDSKTRNSKAFPACNPARPGGGIRAATKWGWRSRVEREKYEKPRLHVYQGQAQNWGIIAITILCRFLFLTRFWDDKAKALLVYGLTDEKLHGKLAFGWQGGWKMHAIRRRAVPRRVNAIRLLSHLSLTWDSRKRDTPASETLLT